MSDGRKIGKDGLCKPPRWRHSGCQARDMNEHHRSTRADFSMEGPGLRPEPEGLLLRPCPRDPYAALGALRQGAPRCQGSEGGETDPPGTRLYISDLVHARAVGGASGKCRLSSEEWGNDECRVKAEKSFPSTPDTLIKIGKLPVKIGAEAYYYIEQDDDLGPEWQVRLLFFPVLPAPSWSRTPLF